MTQAARVLDDLRRGPVDVRDFPPGFRLAARVKDLRDAGHPIDTETVTLPGGTKVARYVLRPTRPTSAPMAGAQAEMFR